MARFHDDTTGKWYNYNADCACCWLNHDHTFEKHLDTLAADKASDEMNQPLWAIKGSNDLYQEYKVLKAKYLAALKATIQLYSEFSY